MVERYVRGVEVAGSNPVTPIFVRIKPFGEYVEGLSDCGDKGYVIQMEVQTHDLQNPPFRTIICANPLILKRLRKFKHLQCTLGLFGPSTIELFDL